MSLAVGVIGAGVMGAEHARILRKETRGAHLAAVADADTARAALAADGAKVYQDGSALIADPAVEAVLVAAPDALHAGFVRACLEAGKPVLCEKPLAMTATEALALVEAEVALGRRLIQVGYMRRFDPGYRELKAAAAERIGRPVLLHNTHRNASAPPWFVGAMPITNSFVHEIDISRWLLEAEMTSAMVHAGPGGEPLMIVMHAESGVMVSTEVYVNAAYGYDVEAELVGSTGVLRMTQPESLSWKSALQRRTDLAENWVPRFAQAYVAQTNAWVQSIAVGQPVGASAWDGYAATALAEQIAAGLAEPRATRLSLPDRPALYGAAPA
jgi:myo-inositol 2-dehydrogenase/D-chiro-inositol 1-dehydrogenase